MGLWIIFGLRSINKVDIKWIWSGYGDLVGIKPLDSYIAKYLLE